MICHIDADAFFASVLQRDNPKLRGKPVLALGMSGGTTVIAASYEAKRMGVRTGMRTKEAKKLAPGAIALSADFAATSLASTQLFELLERWCPGGVERASVDEGYLDLQCASVPFPSTLSSSERSESRGVELKGFSTPRRSSSRAQPRGSGLEESKERWESLAHSLQSEVQRFLALPISVGIAQTKTLAKMASKRNKPRGICIVLEDNREAFLSDLPINAIPGIGVRLSSKLQAHSFERALDLATAPQSIIQQLLGKTGLELRSEVQGIPVYVIVTEPDPPQSISRCRSFLPTGDEHFLFSQLLTHLSYCVGKLRREEFECSRVGVWLRTTFSSSEPPSTTLGTGSGRVEKAERKIGRFVSEEALLIPFVKEALEDSLRATPFGGRREALSASPLPSVGRGKCTQAGLILSHFREKGPRQAELFEGTKTLARIERVQKALDSLRERFGRRSVGYGETLKNLQRR